MTTAVVDTTAHRKQYNLSKTAQSFPMQFDMDTQNDTDFRMEYKRVMLAALDWRESVTTLQTIAAA